MLKHRCAEADWLDAKRLTPIRGYASFCEVFALTGTGNAVASPLSLGIEIYGFASTSSTGYGRNKSPRC
jgi:hypothetical protein